MRETFLLARSSRLSALFSCSPGAVLVGPTERYKADKYLYTVLLDDGSVSRAVGFAMAMMPDWTSSWSQRNGRVARPSALKCAPRVFIRNQGWRDGGGSSSFFFPGVLNVNLLCAACLISHA